MKFTGIMPALVTPLHDDESIDVPVLYALLEHLLSLGADGFYIGGATGEGLCLTQQAREVLAEESVKYIAHRKPCIIHVASTDFKEAIALARQAERVGADAVSAIPPLFFPYDEADVYQYYKALADAVHIPVMIYFNPSAGFHITAKIAAHFFEIDNVTSIKWTNSDFFEMIRLKDMTHGEMNIINGSDEVLLMGLAAGADGGIGTTYNFLLPCIKSIYDSFRAGDLKAARESQYLADRIMSPLFQYSLIPAVKAILERSGFAVGNAAFPMKRYTEEEKDKIFADMLAAGFTPEKTPQKS